MRLDARVNLLRTQWHHLDSQVSAGIETRQATLKEAREALKQVEAELQEAEREARDDPTCAHLFKATRKPRKAPEPATGRTDVRPPQSVQSPTPTKEASMARISKARELDETLDALRKAEKSAGTTKWALSGAGAKKNPPTAARKKALKEKLTAEQARVAALRAKRDELRAA